MIRSYFEMQYCFDLDGTLIDHGHAVRGGLDTLLSFAPQLRIFATEELELRWQRAEDNHFPRFERGEISYQEQRRERLREIFASVSGTIPEQQLDLLYQEYLKGYEANWILYDDVIPTLEQLDQERMALITNGNGEHQRAKLRQLGLSDFFDEVIISAEVGVAKPDRRIFELACDKLGLPAHQLGFVGDSFGNDVIGSAKAGLSAVWINRYSKPAPETNVDFLEIRSLRELL